MDTIPELKSLQFKFPIPSEVLGTRGGGGKVEEGLTITHSSQNSDSPVVKSECKGKSSNTESMDSAVEGDCFRSMDPSGEESQSSFSGASHPPEPIDMDFTKTVYVSVDEEKTKGGNPCIHDLPIHVPGVGPNAVIPASVAILVGRTDPLAVHPSSQTMDSTILPIGSEEKECMWDASMPPSGNVSPHSSIDSTSVVTAMSIVNSSTSTRPSEGIISNGLHSVKGSVRVNSLESAKTSISRISDSSAMSEDSNWSNVIGSTSKPHKGNDPRWKAILAVRARHGDLGMNHFRLLRRLGSGDIGSVYLSELSGTRCCFAIKVMDKASLASRKKLSRAQTEREILQILDHPFLPTLYTHFETDRFSCLVMEFCPGGDLHMLRQRQPRKHFSEYSARFYAAEVLMALEYLHMLGVVYRDLKPENVLVRDDGHIMLSDFDLSLRCTVSPTLIRTSVLDSDSRQAAGAFCVQPACIEPSSVCIQPSCFMPRLIRQRSKKKTQKSVAEAGQQQVATMPELVVEPTTARSMSFVGTHEYLAPEIIKGEGHGSAVDWWTFGIFLHELLYGRTPFKGSGNRATLFNVVGQQLRFPESPSTSYASRDLIRGLLVKEPQHRLGVKRGAAEIKQHPFFEGVNWALIRCGTPPQVPRPVKTELPAELGVMEVIEGMGSSSNKGIVGADIKPGGKYLDFEFF